MFTIKMCSELQKIGFSKYYVSALRTDERDPSPAMTVCVC